MLARLHSALPVAIHFLIELLLVIVLALESLVVHQFVGLHLCQVDISHVKCWTPTNVAISGLLDVQVFCFSECVCGANTFASHCLVLLHAPQTSDSDFTTPLKLKLR